MRINRVLVAATVLAVVLTTGAAQAAGPWPGLAPSVKSTSAIKYSATRKAGITTVKATKDGRVIASTRIVGAFGVPAVTTFGEAGGLSPSGRLLVLAQPPSYEGLRRQSRLLVLSTRTLAKVSNITLAGEFGFDALSPNDRYLYLLQHSSPGDLIHYAVRAYDLRAERLLRGVIVDKRSPDEAMRGYAVARATSAHGNWVYTLYTKGPENAPAFVHALNTAGRYAFCVDLDSWPSSVNVWESRLELSGRTLFVRAKDGTAVARIDTRTLRVM